MVRRVAAAGGVLAVLVIGAWVVVGRSGDGDASGQRRDPGRHAPGAGGTDGAGLHEVVGAAVRERVPLAEAGVEGTILRLVVATGGDPGDEATVDGWVRRYRDGEPLSAIGEAFVATPGFADRYGALDDGAYVERAFGDVLGREASAEDASLWGTRLAEGGGRGELLVALTESPEYVEATGTAPPAAPRPALAPAGVEHSVARVYLGVTGAWPAQATYDEAVRRYLAGTPLAGIADGLLAGAGAPDDVRDAQGEAFVAALYRNLRVKEPGDEAVAGWATRMAAGEGRGAVAAAFTESPAVVARTRTEAPVPAPIPRKLLAVGDSVMLGAVDTIGATPGWATAVDARCCRQPTWRGDGCGAIDIPSGVDALRAAREAGLMGGVVVIHLGNNGPMSVEEFDALMTEVADQRLVFALTLHEPRSYEGPNNAVITGATERWPNLRVIDWHTVAGGHPEWFGDGEGIHLSDAGARAMADLIAAELPA